MTYYMHDENIENKPLAVVNLHEMDGRDALTVLNYLDYTTGNEIDGPSIYCNGTKLYLHFDDETYQQLSKYCALTNFSLYEPVATITAVSESVSFTNGVAFIGALQKLYVPEDVHIKVNLYPTPTKVSVQVDTSMSPFLADIGTVNTEKPKLSGGLVNYYLVKVTNPQRVEQPAYQAECEDIIRALEMTFDEGCEFKAIWRTAAARMGNGKPGQQAMYDAEKRVHYANASLRQYRERNEINKETK